MASWLLSHQAQLQSYLWLSIFALVAVWESFKPRRDLASAVGTRWLNNIALTGLGFLLSRLCLPLVAFSFAVLAEQRGWGLLNQLSLPLWLSCALAVLVIDVGGYAIHRLFHAIPVLWRCHKIHHSELDVDCATAICHHPIESLIVGGTDLAIVWLIGAPPLAVFAAATLGAVASVFNHGNVAVPPAVDRLLRRVVVTPDMHRVHHSAIVEESNRNFAMLFPWWDYLFSTYRSEPRLGHERMELGIAEARTAEDVTLWKLLALPFRSSRIAVSA